MIKRVSDIGFKNIRYNKFIIVSSILSISMALIIFLSMFNFSINSEKTILNNIHREYGEMDLSIMYDSDSEKKFNKELLNLIKNEGGVIESSEVLIDFIDFEGEEIYTVGLEDNNISKSRYKYKSDLKNNEVVINSGLSKKMNKKIGDKLVSGKDSFIIKEIKNDDEKNLEIPNLVLMNIEKMRKYSKSFATGIMIKTDKERVNTLDLANRMRDIDKDFSIDVVDQREDVLSNIRTFKIFIIILGILILIMSGILILINFNTFLYKYRKDFAMFRSMGGSSKQGFKIIIVQSIFINVIGCLIGYSTTYLLNTKIIGNLQRMLSIDITVNDFATTQCLIITIISGILLETIMLIPAYKASKILPLKIIKDNEVKNANLEKNNIAFFIGLVAIGIYIYGLYGIKAQEFTLIYSGVSILLFLISSIMYLKRNVYKLFNCMSNKLKKGGKVIGYVAIKNMLPNVDRYFKIIMSISVLFIIITFVTGMYGALEKNDEKYIRMQNPGDITVTSVKGIESKIDNSFINDMKNVVKTGDVAFIGGEIPAVISSGEKEVLRVKNIDLKQFIDNRIIDNGNNENKNSAIITKEIAKRYNLKVNSEINIMLKEYTDNMESEILDSIGKFRVIDIMEEIPGTSGDIAIDRNNESINKINSYLIENNLYMFEKCIVFTKNYEEVNAELDKLAKKYTELRRNSTDELINDSKEYLFQRYAFFIIAITIMLFIIILGVINALVNDINDRRNEYALLRSLQLSPKSIRRIILIQVSIYLILGIIIGIALGGISTSLITSIEGEFTFIYKWEIICGLALSIFIVIISVFYVFGGKISKKRIVEEIKRKI